MAAGLAFAATSIAVSPIQVVGKNFVHSDARDRFQIIGVE